MKRRLVERVPAILMGNTREEKQIDSLRAETIQEGPTGTNTHLSQSNTRACSPGTLEDVVEPKVPEVRPVAADLGHAEGTCSS